MNWTDRIDTHCAAPNIMYERQMGENTQRAHDNDDDSGQKKQQQHGGRLVKLTIVIGGLI